MHSFSNILCFIGGPTDFFFLKTHIKKNSTKKQTKRYSQWSSNILRVTKKSKSQRAEQLVNAICSVNRNPTKVLIKNASAE